MSRPPVPPFTAETAAQKAHAAEDSWNTRDPARVALAYTAASRWRNRAEFLQGRAEIETFLARKWAREIDYRLIKEVWAFRDNRIAVRFAYEWRDDSSQWFRSYGNENWEFDGDGLMSLRLASINDLPIAERERKYHWPLGPRPDSHPGLSELGLLAMGITGKLAVCLVCAGPAFASPPPSSAGLMTHCAALYDAWKKYEQDPALFHSGERAPAELALYRCQQGDYPANIAVLEELLRRGRFATPENLGTDVAQSETAGQPSQTKAP